MNEQESKDFAEMVAVKALPDGMLVDYDPAQYPCGLATQMWYELLWNERNAA